eukprot:CAMPEP_0194043170 /NCGR_PEP_ID=MMETSP0009_2-20130614/14851_1 /TAXON_ID=210454 /ORGANISM="Grammatophora oceanica, Strain CCMP 410" /LENGTH=260 /DNA_ID=CAMNT_0038687293 /DNA_START=88 /DNA_END=870 /DNA_ORIENTATION=-
MSTKETTKVEGDRFANGATIAENEVTYERQTNLYKWIGRKDWEDARKRLDAHPEEAGIWVVTKYKGGALVNDDNENVVWYRRLPLHHASGMKGVPQDFLKALLEAYPEALTAKDETGKVPLIHACRRDIPVDVLLGTTLLTEETAKIPDNEGKCALHVACEYRSPLPMIRTLVETAPTILEHKDEYGRIPLHWECSIIQERKNKLPVVKYLVEKYSAGAKLADLDGKTPLQMMDGAEVFCFLQSASENGDDGDANNEGTA